MGSSEFYEAFYQKAREAIPGFLFDQVKAQALPLSGATARWKASVPTIFEKLALPMLQPENLGKLKNVELKSALKRIDKLYRGAVRKKEDALMFQKAAAGVVKEMRDRKVSVDAKLAVLQEWIGKSDEELEEFNGAPVVHRVEKRGEVDNMGAPVNPRGFNVGETLTLVEEHGRWSQDDANYVERTSDPYKACGACRFFIRDPKSEVGTCQVVQGPINWFGTSDLYVSAASEANYAFHVSEHMVHEAMMDQAFGVQKSDSGSSNDDNNTDPQEPKMVITVKELIQKRIKKTPEGKYQVTTDDGKKVLGTHATRADAIRQLAAVEANKEKTEKAGPTVSQVHTPGSDGKKNLKKKKDPMGALNHDTNDVTNNRESVNVKTKPKAMPDSVTNNDGAAKVKKTDSIEVMVEKECVIAKIDDEQKKIYGIVLEPDEVDTQGDTISSEEIEKAAEGFMKKARTIGLRHRKIAKGVTLTDSYVTQGETTLGKTKLKKGTWIIGVKVENETIWKGVKNGEYNGFSVGGIGRREKNA